MRITREDQGLEHNDPLLCEIKEVKERVKAQEELVTI